jgi:hypothetical protein
MAAPLPYAPKKNIVHWSDCCGLKVYQGRNQSKTKRRGLLSKCVSLLHDNARSHAAAHTVETLRHLKSEVLEHPSYCPDLAPLDYHLFGPLRDALRCRHWPSSERSGACVACNSTKKIFLRAYERLWVVVPSALNRRKSIFKNDALVKFSISVVLILKIILFILSYSSS